ncbi:MAG: hypothetical protein IT184_02325 [Acidobacteria bacterium]|nr:hypothetical protein [Acidobacteriota bacterium]
MRLVDAILRQGHLSEAALVDALITGERPAHLDQCDICGERALAFGRGLDAIRFAATTAADELFPPDRLAGQQAQILRRLEQLDEPAKVIAFPAAPAAMPRAASRYRVAPGWLGVAAAAGLIIGAIGGHGTAKLSSRPSPQAPSSVASEPATGQPAEADRGSTANASVFDMDLESFIPEPLGAINELTPRTTVAVRLSASAR